MHRIATAMLIAAAVLALNAGMLRDAFARDTATQLPVTRLDILQPVQVKSAKVLALLLVLESLRQAPFALDGQKV
jgi:hypothetical protein